MGASNRTDTVDWPAVVNTIRGEGLMLKAVARKIGVAPMNPQTRMPDRPKYVRDCNILPDDVQADAANIIQGRASCGERPPNAFRRD